MINSHNKIAKLKETNILTEYSNYLQSVTVLNDNERLTQVENSGSIILNYDQFKEYYIMSLAGINNYVDNLVFDYQFGIAES